jgi:hypothetical protein
MVFTSKDHLVKNLGVGWHIYSILALSQIYEMGRTHTI